ncbi:MAG TPA: hypothetical protein VGM36_08855 [Rhizomicrobium sp.]|jgi:hypothetical protein
MSELITTRRADFRWQLLTTVSALSLLGAATTQAKAEDTDRPTVWIELGAQSERLDSSQQEFVPPFLAHSVRAPLWNETPMSVERPGRYAIGGEGKISFEPAGTNWVFSASLRYGRSNRSKSLQQQSNAPTLVPYNGGMVPAIPKLYDDATGKSSSSHAILDFMAGKDVGLGVFGGDSKLNFGVRFAQFASGASGAMQSRPTLGHIQHVNIFGSLYANYYYPRNFKAAFSNSRSFHGVGPSISWDASAPVIGNKDAGEVTFDWGLNAAVLFGRQKARVHHQTSGNYVQMSNLLSKYNVLSSYHHMPPDKARSHSVVVPNVGGFAGVSFKFPNAKISMGYRADIFFGAMDAGIDTRKTYNQAFYGPFATISIGLGG